MEKIVHISLNYEVGLGDEVEKALKEHTFYNNSAQNFQFKERLTIENNPRNSFIRKDVFEPFFGILLADDSLFAEEFVKHFERVKKRKTELLSRSNNIMQKLTLNVIQNLTLEDLHAHSLEMYDKYMKKLSSAIPGSEVRLKMMQTLNFWSACERTASLALEYQEERNMENA